MGLRAVLDARNQLLPSSPQLIAIRTEESRPINKDNKLIIEKNLSLVLCN
jgi:hypothetical protein